MNNDHKFTYTAGSLRKPLRALRKYLTDYVSKNADVAREAGKLVRMKSSLGTVSDAEVLAARAVQDFKAMQYDLGRCDLWLAECERLWWFKRIDLDESELKWVHRYRATLPIAPPSSL